MLTLRYYAARKNKYFKILQDSSYSTASIASSQMRQGVAMQSNASSNGVSQMRQGATMQTNATINDSEMRHGVTFKDDDREVEAISNRLTQNVAQRGKGIEVKSVSKSSILIK